MFHLTHSLKNTDSFRNETIECFNELLNQSLDSVNESLLNELVESIGCRVRSKFCILLQIFGLLFCLNTDMYKH